MSLLADVEVGPYRQVAGAEGILCVSYLNLGSLGYLVGDKKIALLLLVVLKKYHRKYH